MLTTLRFSFTGSTRICSLFGSRPWDTVTLRMEMSHNTNHQRKSMRVSTKRRRSRCRLAEATDLVILAVAGNQWRCWFLLHNGAGWYIVSFSGLDGSWLSLAPWDSSAEHKGVRTGAIDESRQLDQRLLGGFKPSITYKSTGKC
jgi:hypothetical protein